ncbi:putative aldehyde dehydrogenase [Streptomyces sp. RB17]|uniref:aldehyde dehydrogenase family protein n=1 Tax=Streptomyces sp. RB17 TaxID=2585197 RepID=UPI00130AF930|nr:aldehyde dehydrogenase family protein [Streptomyces sp. RB17]MQY40770.1 putative aldehyde dehydrogenase [Streptomyces sp. RB17]
MTQTDTTTASGVKKLYIDGSWVSSRSTTTMWSINPATEEKLALVPEGSREDADQAVQAARRAFDNGPWPRLSVEERRAHLVRMYEIMQRRFAELVELNIQETGSIPSTASDMQVGLALELWRDMVERIMPTFAWERPAAAVAGHGVGQGIIVREPIGVASLITAYNFPLFIAAQKLAPALAAGCTVVLKPAPTTPLQGLVWAEIAEEAGLPAGVVNVVTGDREISEELTTHPGVDMVSFTGSVPVGKAVYEQAARSLKRVVLELGGKSAHIICDDADLAPAVEDILFHTTTHAGQGCVFLTRTLVHRSRLQELVKLLKARMEEVVTGDPRDPRSTMGPLISAQQRERVESLIQTGLDEGATIAVGGGRPAGSDRGFFVQPAVFVDVDNSMTIAQNEFFGPVNVVIPFDTDDDAVRIANDSDFGLGGAVRAKDPARALSIARRLRTGNVSINGGGGAATLRMPYGGYKNSGLGKENGDAGLDGYLETKSISWSVAAG